MRSKIHAATWALAGAVVLVAGCEQIGQLGIQAPPSPVVRVAAASSDVGTDAAAGSGSPFGAYLAGLYAGRQQDLASAADYMLQALASDPENEQLLDRAFVLSAADGRRAKAVELARRLGTANPDQGLAGLVLAVDAAARGEMDEAEGLLAAMPEKGLNTITAPLLRSWVQVAKGDLAAARERVAPLRNRNGFGVFYSLHLALLNDVGGEMDAAKTAYDEALAASDKPTMRLAWVVGNFFERASEKDRAVELYRSMLERSPDFTLFETALARIEAGGKPEPVVASPADGMAEALFNLASLLSQERAEEVALVHAHLALWLKPDFEIARILIGEALQGQGRRAEAITVYRQIPADSPFFWMAGLRIAEELENLERVDEAITELESLAAARPDSFEPLYRLGNLYRSRERFADAVSAYDRAAARLGAPDRRHWSLYYFRGIALERSSEWPRAEKDFLLALTLEPDQPFVLNYLAYSWVEKKLNLDKAKGMLARAVELRPDDGFIVDSLGWAHYRLGDYEEGVKYLERAVELRPQDPVINDHLGDAYWRVGRHQEARFQWRRALSLKPEPDTVATIESKIQNGMQDTGKDI
ncbi:MAG TPA: tetratricopeptide repeat protein [Kiloniellales bacterium]